jgi:Pvc16 N-terminal domain
MHGGAAVGAASAARKSTKKRPARCVRCAGREVAYGENGGMIHDADRSLAAWLGTMLPPGTEVRLGAPDPDWVRHKLEQPIVDVFLYDIAEDINGLSTDAVLVRDPDGRPTAWQLPARRYRLSYLLTTWSADVSAEHEMLGCIMAGCATAAVIPAEFLHGTLVDAGLPVQVQCAPPREAHGTGEVSAPAGTAELCQALGVPPRAALTMVLVAPLVPAARTDVAPSARSLDLDMTVMTGSAGDQPVSPRGRLDRGPQRRWESARITERHT